jgi:diguanylate cyclase (GGDEF)-like protein
MTAEEGNARAQAVVQYLSDLIQAPSPSLLPSELSAIPGIGELQDALTAFREQLAHVAQGDLAYEAKIRGYLGGLLKMHVANLRHLTWQVKQISQGDFSQHVDFMGEFSISFNNMVEQLHTTLTSLRNTEKALTDLTSSLREEVAMRSAAVDALKQSEARFKYLADHDPLTGTMNRRSFLLITEAGMESARRKGVPCCLALLDVDNFKRFNDFYGHVNGDLALKQVVRLAQASLRQSDRMGRYGGEEFIFFFAEADLDRGTAAAERIRKTIATVPVEISAGNVAITVSMGVSVLLPEWGDRKADFTQKLIAMADAALYDAKQQGRNRVCQAPILNPALFVPPETEKKQPEPDSGKH